MSRSYADEKAIVEQALMSVSSAFNETEIEDVQSFIRVGEYPLAFETILGIIIERDKRLDKQQYRILRAGAAAIGAAPELTIKLAGHVNS